MFSMISQISFDNSLAVIIVLILVPLLGLRLLLHDNLQYDQFLLRHQISLHTPHVLFLLLVWQNVINRQHPNAIHLDIFQGYNLQPL